MGKVKKYKTGASSSNPDRRLPKGTTTGGGGGSMRNKNTIKRLNMYSKSGAIRNKKGKIIGGEYMSSDRSGDVKIAGKYGKHGGVARVAPDRRWFGNTRVVDATKLDTFREKMSEASADPYQVVLQRKKLPMALIADKLQGNIRSARDDVSETTGRRMNLLTAESFSETFSAKRRRKRPKLSSTMANLSELLSHAQNKTANYSQKKDIDAKKAAEQRFGPQDRDHKEGRDVFMKGQSKRIWEELNKVVDCSDVVVQVLDARDPLGTRSQAVEEHIAKEKSHKHLVFVLNKCDLIPTWATRRWVSILSKDYPTLAFHASMTNSFGKGSLIQLLRQFSELHKDKKEISVGFIGYPNVGKSSIINTLKKKKGETKVWQYITLMKRINLIDCPGTVPPSDTATESDIVLLGVTRSERLPCPEEFVQPILDRVKIEYLRYTYGLTKTTAASGEKSTTNITAAEKEKEEKLYKSSETFLTALARKTGRLLKGGEPDISTVARMVINDWQRGKLPHFVSPPKDPKEDTDENDDSVTTTSSIDQGGENANKREGKDIDEQERKESSSSEEAKGEGNDSDDMQINSIEQDLAKVHGLENTVPQQEDTADDDKSGETDKQTSSSEKQLGWDELGF
eukprot:g498.t1